MSVPAKLKRYLLILEKVQAQPSFAELHDHLAQHGFELSHRTLQRDIERLRLELGIEVGYDRPNNVYRITGPSEEHDNVLRLLERAQLFELVGDDPKRIRELAQHIDFEGLGRLQGLQHLSTLLRAIRERKEVIIEYQRFQSDRSSEHRVQPLLLKEYHGRWYVLGDSPKYARPVTLGLDRIVSLRATAKRSARDRSDKARAVLATIIGVDASPEKVERVVIEVTAEQAKYIRSLPWHASQQVEKENEAWVTISWVLRPNYELRQRLLGHGAHLRVLEPAWLAKEIGKEHRSAAELYKR